MNLSTYRRVQLVPGLLLAITALAVATDASANAQQRNLVERYLIAGSDGGAAAMVDFYRPADIEEFRTRVLKALEAEAARKDASLLKELFGSASTLEDVRRLTPTNFLLAATRRIDLPAVPAKKVKVLGIVDDDEDVFHVVARAWVDEKGKGDSRVVMVTIVPYFSNQWRIAVPEAFRVRVDMLMSNAADTTERVTKTRDTPNTPEILALLDAGSEALRNGDCKGFFAEQMSPNFRKNLTEKGLNTLVTQCEKRIETRETYLSALELARRQAPLFQENGARAVYDFKGQGLPFDHFTLERVGDRWYVAE